MADGFGHRWLLLLQAYKQVVRTEQKNDTSDDIIMGVDLITEENSPRASGRINYKDPAIGVFLGFLNPTVIVKPQTHLRDWEDFGLDG